MPKFGSKNYHTNDPLYDVKFQVIKPTTSVNVFTITEKFDVKKRGGGSSGVKPGSNHQGRNKISKLF